jgi:HlyD family secretion protein
MSSTDNVPVRIDQGAPYLPALLPSTAADEFLPAPGSWSHRLGHRVLIGLVSTGLALVIWPWQETVRASGVVRPTGENSLVQSERGGTVLAVLVQPNQRVEAGQVMARLDDRALRDQEQQLETEISRLERQQLEASNQRRALADQRNAATSLTVAQVLGF